MALMEPTAEVEQIGKRKWRWRLQWSRPNSWIADIVVTEEVVTVVGTKRTARKAWDMVRQAAWRRGIDIDAKVPEEFRTWS